MNALDNVKYVIFDTETTGLNIVCDRPFMVQYLYCDKDLNELDKNIFYVKHRNKDDEQREQDFKYVLEHCNTIVGANIKFDIHQLLNIGYPEEWFKHKNYIDVQVLARLVINHDLQTDKTFGVALKKLAVRYLGTDCNREEQLLKHELSLLQQKHKEKMLQYFINNKVVSNDLSRKEKTELINKIYGDNWFKYYEKFDHIKPYRIKFLKDNPEPNYSNVSNINTYALTDVILTHGLFKLWYKECCTIKGQTEALKRTSAATWPLIVMERQGLVIDIKKIANDRSYMINFKEQCKIIDPRTNQEISIGQHEVLRQIYEYETGLKLSSSDQKTRDKIVDKSPTARLVNSITKLEKLIYTYATKLLREVRVVDGEFKVFTQYNMANTVTGRLSSDFQQFPKEPTQIGDRTIAVRSWFVKPKDIKYMVYEDYAQQELKLQCEWSGLVNGGKPDLIMTRASEPYQCHKGEDGEWYLDEDPKTKWVPTDLHALTAKNAFPDIDETHPEWKHYRKLGKCTNFASNYGCSAPTLASNIGVDLTTAQRLVKGYRTTFKGVVQYGNWIRNSVATHEYLPNLFHRRYYSRNSHQLQNWLVQGSGADILLIKLAQLYPYLEEHPWWNFMISVHDEIGFSVKDIPQEQMIKEAKEIQEIMKVELNFVNVVTDIEVSDTNWADKIELEEFIKKGE